MNKAFGQTSLTMLSVTLLVVQLVRSQVAAIRVAFGSLASACSQGYGGLMFGRVFVGLGVGFGLAVSTHPSLLEWYWFALID